MLPGPSTITLDQESFKALASEVRVDILKRLDERRETVTDLSALLGLSKPTLLEHLEKLQAAGLVKRVDEGRKWIYYELSLKGRRLLHPEKVAIVLALSSAVGLAAIGLLLLLAASGGGGLLAANPATGNLSAPGATRSGLSVIFSDPYGVWGTISLGFAAMSAAVATVLVWIGRRRRARLFSEVAKD